MNHGASDPTGLWPVALPFDLACSPGNTAIQLAETEVRLVDAVLGSIFFVVPAALLGVGIVRICRRLPPAGERPLFFWTAQLALSVGYAALFSVSVVALRSLENWLTGGEPLEISPVWYAWYALCGLMIYGSLAGVGYGLQTAARLRREEARTAKAEALRTEAELAALRAQLNPHFLFNTLHSLLALVRHDPDHAEQALEQFGDLLRYALRIQQETVDEVTLAEEWTFVENYLELERLRLGDRLRLEIDLEPEALRCRVPVFSLQPLVENAVGHAVAPRAAGGTVRIRARVAAGELLVEVADDGPGADPEELGRGDGLGLAIVRQRLQALSHGRARFDVETAGGQGFTVRLRMPGEPGAGAEAAA